jgi:2-phosphosulfolactate phosphatase
VDVHVEWGAIGAQLAAERGDLVVVVDVLSFSTAVSLAASRGAVALSYSEPEIEASGGREALCASLGAEIVAKDRRATDARFSLSPASLATIATGDRLIFTSLNGAACTSAASPAPEVVVGCLTNRTAVGSFVASRLSDRGARRCTIIAAGEHWSSSTGTEPGIRPGVEDWLGAGAIAAAMRAHDLRLSLEARLAVGSYEAAAGGIAGALDDCISGRELIAKGFADDVALAADVDSVEVVPVWDTTDPVRQFEPIRPA